MTFTDQDVKLARAFIMNVYRKNAGGNSYSQDQIQFQLPPHISSDGQSAEWDEQAVGPFAGDKLAMFKSTNPRNTTIEWTYILDNNSEWNAEKIHDQLRKIRGYFRLPALQLGSLLLIRLSMWSIGGTNPQFMTFRMASADIKHDKTLVGTGRNAFPLRTTVSASLKPWTKVWTDSNAEFVLGQETMTTDWF